MIFALQYQQMPLSLKRLRCYQDQFNNASLPVIERWGLQYPGINWEYAAADILELIYQTGVRLVTTT